MTTEIRKVLRIMGLNDLKICRYKKCLTIAMLLMLFLTAVPALASEEKYNVVSQDKPIPPDLLKALGGAMLEDQQKFEDKIKGLLFLAVNDINVSFGTHKIDMQARKIFFTEKAWEEYKEYILDRKNKLRTRQKNSEDQVKEQADLIYGSQNYSDLDDAKKFNADFTLSYGRSDHYTSMPQIFHIDLLYKGDFVSPESIIIERWSVKSAAAKD